MNDDLIVPIDVDTNVLLDLLASIEGGFSVVEKVTTRTAATSNSDKALSLQSGTEFGIPNVLSLLKINLGGSLTSKKGEETGKQTESERYHTYGSLLHRLRSHLDNEKIIKRLKDQESWDAIQSSEFIEVRGIFRPNPLADALQIIDRLMGLIHLFAGTQGNLPADKKKSNLDQKEIGNFSKFIKGIIADLEKENIRTFVVDLIEPPMHKVVLSLFVEYLRDPTMTEIAHKEYCVLGKVVRKIGESEEDAIDLLRGTGLGGIGKQAIEQMAAMLQIQGMNLPKIETVIKGPALEIVPIAIFV